MAKPSTRERVYKAVEALKRGKKDINPSSVARKAGIERKTLYNNPELLTFIQQTSEAKKVEIHSTSAFKISVPEQRIRKYQTEIQKLAEDKGKLLYQNKLLTEEVTRLQRRLHELEQIIHQRVTPIHSKSLQRRNDDSTHDN